MINKKVTIEPQFPLQDKRNTTTTTTTLLEEEGIYLYIQTSQ